MSQKQIRDVGWESMVCKGAGSTFTFHESNDTGLLQVIFLYASHVNHESPWERQSNQILSSKRVVTTSHPYPLVSTSPQFS